MPFGALGTALPLLIGCTLLVGACSRDELAPDCLNSIGVCIDEAVSLDCSLLPDAAIGAEYSLVLPATGGSGNFSDWQAVGLPMGLEIDPGTGEIFGTPGLANDVALGPPNAGDDPISYDVVFSGIDTETGQPFDLSCPLTVQPPLNALGLADSPEHCLPVTATREDLLDVLDAGDGADITCRLAGPGAGSLGNGDGTFPEGITFDEDACEHTGSIVADQHGTWMWMIEVQQSGYSTFVPYCASNDVAEGDPGHFHTIIHTVDGVDTDPLTPGFYPYDPTQNLSFGNGSHQWEIISQECTMMAQACMNYGFRFEVGPSPFDTQAPWEISLSPSAKTATGMTHEMIATGPVPEDKFRNRPWIIPFEMAYCTSEDNTVCDVDDPNFMQNAQTRYHYDVIAFPTVAPAP